MRRNGVSRTKEKLIDAAVRLICRKGYDHVEMAEIWREAGVPAAAARRCFPTKIDIARAVLGRYQDRYYDTVLAAEDARLRGEDRARAMVRTMVDLYRNNIELALAADDITTHDIPEIQRADLAGEKQHHAAVVECFGGLGLDIHDRVDMTVMRGLLTRIIEGHFAMLYQSECRLKKTGPLVRKAMRRMAPELAPRYNDAFYERYIERLARFYMCGVTGLAKPAAREDGDDGFGGFWKIGMF